jgi:hypothetical protein
MSPIAPSFRAGGASRRRPQGLLATDTPRRLASRAARPGTPGLIAPGPGLSLPRIQETLWQFSPTRGDGAFFAANLLRAGVGRPEDWEASRDIGKFLHATLERFVGDRAKDIDYAFDVAVTLSTSPTNWRQPEEIDPRRVLLTFRVAHTVGWVNLMPALKLLEEDHAALPALFYHRLNDSLSRWFRVFDVGEARYGWESWRERLEEDAAERKEECERDCIPFEPQPTSEEPRLPDCVKSRPRGRIRDLHALARSPEAQRLLEAIERLWRASRRDRCPKLDPQEREDMFYDTDPAVPMISLAFGEHDVVTEMLNMELETSGQVEPEPWPILLMDSTDPASIRKAFRCAGCVLDTLVEASRTLSLVPGFEPMTRETP